MFTKRLVFYLFIVGYAHSIYIADIEVDIETSKKIVRLEIGERDYYGNNLPSRFFLIIDGERIEFFHRILDNYGSYDINLGGRGGLNHLAGQEFVSFTRKSLIIVNSNIFTGTFYMGGDIELDNNQKLKFFTTPKLTRTSDKKKRIVKRQIVNQQTTVTKAIHNIDWYGKSCALGRKLSFCDQCGLALMQPNVKRIVGGTTVAQTSWPSVGFLLGRAAFFGSTYNLRCTVTLIERTTVITAAQCYLKSFGIKSYTLVLGIHKMGLFSYIKFPQIKSFITHPNYNNMNSYNDIAVIKLTSEVAYDLYTQPACLPLASSVEPTSDQKAWIVGYGTTSFGGSYPDYLQNAAVTYYASSGDKCKNFYGRFDSSIQICAGDYDNGVVDSCNGDSGGPLYTKDETFNTYVLAGVTSGGFRCGARGHPGIYTNVRPYLKWIIQNIYN